MRPVHLYYYEALSIAFGITRLLHFYAKKYP